MYGRYGTVQMDGTDGTWQGVTYGSLLPSPGRPALIIQLLHHQHTNLTSTQKVKTICRFSKSTCFINRHKWVMVKQCPHLTRLPFVYFRKISILCTRTIISPPRLTSVKDQAKLQMTDWSKGSAQSSMCGRKKLTTIFYWTRGEKIVRTPSMKRHDTEQEKMF